MDAPRGRQKRKRVSSESEEGITEIRAIIGKKLHLINGITKVAFCVSLNTQAWVDEEDLIPSERFKEFLKRNPTNEGGISIDGLGFTALENRNSSKLAHSVIPSVAGTSGGFTAAQTVAAKDGEGPHSAESINGDSHARESSGSAVSTHSGELSQEKEISGSEEGDFSQFDYSPKDKVVVIEQGYWRHASVVAKDEAQHPETGAMVSTYLVHYKGFRAKFDEWVMADSMMPDNDENWQKASAENLARFPERVQGKNRKRKSRT